MSNGGNPLIFFAGIIAAGGLGYYLYKGGYFDKIIESLNSAIDKIMAGGNGDGNSGCASGKIKCKDGKCDSQSNCDKQAGCKADEDWNPSSKKCLKKASLAMAYTTPEFWSGSHRGYVVTNY